MINTFTKFNNLEEFHKKSDLGGYNKYEYEFTLGDLDASLDQFKKMVDKALNAKLKELTVNLFDKEIVVNAKNIKEVKEYFGNQEIYSIGKSNNADRWINFVIENFKEGIDLTAKYFNNSFTDSKCFFYTKDAILMFVNESFYKNDNQDAICDIILNLAINKKYIVDIKI
jgi:hypothetical protein